MKKALSLILAVLLLCTSLAGCDNSKADPIGDNVTRYTTEGKVTKLVKNSELKGELSVYLFGGLSQEYLDRAQKIFSEYFPSVQLTIKPVDSGWADSFADNIQKLQTELMSGGGPDVFSMAEEFIDPYKTMRAGAYADLTPLFEKDPNFNPSDFNQNVLYSGQFKGKQYVVPIQYFVPVLLSTQSIMQDIGFDSEKCIDYNTTAEEVGRVVQENKLNCTGDLIFDFHIPFYSLTYLGSDWIDYETDTVNIDTPAIKKSYEIGKNSFLQDTSTFRPVAVGYAVRDLIATELQQKNLMFFSMANMGIRMFSNNVRALTGIKEEPVILPWKNENGKLQANNLMSVAVNSSTKNLEAAYAFIKVLLSAEFNDMEYLNTFDGGFGIPLNSKIVSEYLYSRTEPTNFQDTQNVYKFGELPESLITQYLEILNDVESLTYVPAIYDDVREIMLPYLEGTKSYESCIKEAQSKLEIYVSE